MHLENHAFYLSESQRATLQRLDPRLGDLLSSHFLSDPERGAPKARIVLSALGGGQLAL